MAFCKRGIWDRIQDDKGSLTLEASLVLPGVMLITFALILLSLMVADRAAHYYTVSIAGERAAFAWPHSSANIRTGGYPQGSYDSLYWRLKDDGMLAGLLGWAANEDGGLSVRIDPGGGETEGEDTEGRDPLSLKKLRQTAAVLPAGVDGTVSYRNRLWLREVKIAANGTATSEPLRILWPQLSSAASASVTAVVTEPAEWLRTFQVVRYYFARMQQKGQEAEDYRSQAAAVLEHRR